MPPRYHPRRYSAEPKGFGKVSSIRWRSVEPGTEDQHLAAKIQHSWAVQISRAADERYGSLKAYAQTAGVSYDRLARVIRGEEIMRLEDIATARRVLDITTPENLLS